VRNGGQRKIARSPDRAGPAPGLAAVGSGFWFFMMALFITAVVMTALGKSLHSDNTIFMIAIIGIRSLLHNTTAVGDL
jgi:hypothetical protein